MTKLGDLVPGNHENFESGSSREGKGREIQSLGERVRNKSSLTVIEWSFVEAKVASKTENVKTRDLNRLTLKHWVTYKAQDVHFNREWIRRINIGTDNKCSFR